MNFKEKISLIVQTCAAIGPLETFKALGRYVLQSDIDDSNFDRRNSTDTASPLTKQELAISDRAARSYRTASERFIGYLISHLGINYQEYDFVDVGCGKGRVLLVASNFPFRSICGIELSPPAIEVAQKNVRIYRRGEQKCINIYILNADARHFEPPLTNTVYYFFEPFDLSTLDAVLTRISSKLRGQGKRIYVVCIWSDLPTAIKLFGDLGFKTIRIQKMLVPLLNYAIFSL
jgi:SAM-dependent methyltransferase